MAWLNAKPKPDKPTGKEPPAISRSAQMVKDGLVPRMPPNPAPHIIGWLTEMGLVEAAGMGTAALSWREIDAWCRRTCVDLPPWEARLIRQLSVDYQAESHRAESAACAPPWDAKPAVADRKAEDARMRGFFSGMRAR